MKEYLSVLQSIDRDALKAKAEVARSLAGEYAQQAKAAAGVYAQEARTWAGEAMRSPRAEALAASAKTLAQDVRGDVVDFCAFTTQRVRGFSPFDFAVFKLLMISFGLWLGAWLAARFSRLTEKLRPVFLAAFFCGFTYIAYRIFFDERE